MDARLGHDFAGAVQTLQSSSGMPALSPRRGESPRPPTTAVIQRTYSVELNQAAARGGGLRAMLLTGTQGLAAHDVLAKIMSNFREVPFSYTLTHVSGADFLAARRVEGDCKTLAEAFVNLAQEIGFDDVRVESKVAEIVLPYQPCIGWVRRPATDRGRHWAFDNHYWAADGTGRKYDILFQTHTVGNTWMPKQGPRTKDEQTGLTVEVFGEKSFYSGVVGNTPYDMVVLEESELQGIRATHASESAASAKPALSEDTEDSDEELDPFEELSGLIEGIVPGALRTATASKLLADLGGNAVVIRVLVPELQKFCSGSNPIDLKFEKDRWDKWIKP